MVNANAASAYARLFAEDAIWMPPGDRIYHGSDEIAAKAVVNYDRARWSVALTPGNALSITDSWVYGIAHVDVIVTERADGKTTTHQFKVTWLLHREPDGAWKIKRQMWNEAANNAQGT